MLCTRDVCLRRMAQGLWSAQMRFWRFVSNPQVTVEKLIAGWSVQTRTAVGGRHVLAIQDTSDIKFATTQEDRRGLGKVGKGNVFGILLHALMAVDADSGACLGLAGGKVWSRKGTVKTSHSKRALADKESSRWLSTAAQAKDVLAQARTVTVINDREGDFYAHWACTPEDNLHLLSRVMHDHALVEGGTLRKAVKRVTFCGKAVVELPKRMDRKARKAHLCLRFGGVTLKKPSRTGADDLPQSVALNFVEVVELHPPKGCKPIHWLLLTTHKVKSAADAWQIVAWYKLRWIIEQFFRSMKTQGLRIEDSQLESAERLMKMVAIAAKAAAIVIQLVQARNGGEQLPADFAFSHEEIDVLNAINKGYQGKTELQNNPHRTSSLPWAAWIIARLGGWSGYASHKPPGPITFHNGLARFQILSDGARLNV
jgi:molybdopterin-guanine dinucleotide biosynthesis protein